MSEESKINPYQVSSGVVETTFTDLANSPSEPIPKASLLRTAVRWFFVCGISCIPSFTIGLGIASSPPLAMVMGVILFAVGYTALDYATAGSPVRQNSEVSRTLKIAYGTRIAITIIFPVGLYLDMMCGILSVSAMEFLLGSQQLALESFAGALITTLAQGITLNGLLALYALLVHGAQLVVIRVWTAIPTG